MSGRLATMLALIGLLAAACSGPILANPTLPPPVVPTAVPVPSRPPDPQPIVFPRDAGPHDRLTEWWYYTGHLVAEDGRRFGFEAVVFRAERGAAPVTWASHLALTDESGDRFLYAQRAAVGAGVDRSPRAPDGTPTGFTLFMPDVDPATGVPTTNPPWQLSGTFGHHVIAAAQPAGTVPSATIGFSLDLDLIEDRPPALHGGAGWVDFGPAGSSYYYSVTRLRTIGRLTLGDETLDVSGTAWFDHQWGDFIAVGGGWDWFAVNLEDGTDLTISVVRAVDGSTALAYGTIVDAGGSARHLAASEFTVAAVPGKTWTSAATGITYPAGWTISVPGEALTIDLTPTVADQELDTRPTTGVVYWEGSQDVVAMRGRRFVIPGKAYVELTGYVPAHP